MAVGESKDDPAATKPAESEEFNPFGNSAPPAGAAGGDPFANPFGN